MSTPLRDVVVVGAGPAGSLAAGLLARAGASVLLVDRATFPRWTVCGACLAPAGVAVLRQVGWDGILDEAGAPRLDRLVIRGWGTEVELPMAGGRALSRARLDAALVASAVGEGAELRPGTGARLGPVRDGAREVLLSRGGDEERVRARVVVAATGLHPIPREGAATVPPFRRAPGSRVGVGAVVADWEAGPPPGTVRMTAGPGGYVGQVRQEDGRCVVAAALDPDWIRRHDGPGSAVRAVLADASIDSGSWTVEEGWRGTPTLTGGPSRPSAERVVYVGDAAGYVEPFTGEGMGWALAGARAAVPLVLEACRTTGRTEPWDRRYRTRVARRQRLCRGVAWLSRRPRLAQGVLGLLARAPWLARPALSRAAWEPEYLDSPWGGHA
ncbi:MAG TPA: FAD-dependent monooxygenase [Longimicrobiales bacterium]|nr:FAD-dependent monooxygenase [Longimicrobiales bacterium]